MAWRPVALGGLLALAGCSPEPSPLVDGGWVPSGHYEGVVEREGSLLPLLVDPEEHELTACVEAPPTADTSLWQGAFSPAGTEAAPTDPARRFGRSLCFRVANVPSAPGERFEVCGRLVDRYSGIDQSLECASVHNAEDPAGYWGIRDQLSPLLERAAARPTEALLADLDRLAEASEDAGYPFFSLRLRLISVFYLRRAGEPRHLTEAARRLGELPDWIDAPQASGWAAQLAMERSSLALHRSRLRDAWHEAQLAERRFLVSAHPKTIAAVARQAEILALVGSLAEARERLSAALDECDEAPCHPPLLPHAKSSLAWWIVSDPTASVSELGRAARLLDEALSADSSIDEPLERGNLYVNRAYVEVRRGEDPSAHLAEARSLTAISGSARAQAVAEWSDLVETLWMLRDGRSAVALAAATDLAVRTESPEVAAAAWSATGRAHRRLGDLDRAATAFESSLALHRHLSAAQLGQRIALGPGQRAEDTYRAARVATERRRPAEGWRYLADLDRVDSVAGCAPDEVVDLAETARRRDELLRQLVALERPASAARRAQRQPIRRGVLVELQALSRLGGCEAEPTGRPAAEPRFRAVSLDDEVLLLERRPDGAVSVARRAALDRQTVRAVLDEVDRRAATSDRSEVDWRRLLQPLAAALAPPVDEPLPPVTTYALHGDLQRVPLAALPLGDAAESSTRWLADRTTIAVRAAGATAAADRPAAGAAPLFIVDPTSNLSAGDEAAATYRQLFPGAVVLHRDDATRRRALVELERANWLHVGAHGRYDAAFPELSSVRLADDDLGAVDLAALAPKLDLANLSACHSGRWPVTADSGRFGLAGQLARVGVPWVVASRAALPDRVALDFNRVFYGDLARGASVPQAYAAGLRAVRDAHAVTDWAGLFLLVAEPPASGGQTAPMPIPIEAGSAPALPATGGRT